jgi:hypothetical protein
MTKYKILIALSCGAGCSASLILFLNLPMPVVPALLSLLLLPGAAPIALLTKSEGFGPSLGVLAANALVYAGIAYAGVSVFCRRVGVEKMRLATFRLVVSMAILFSLACIPSLNPLSPRGMTELTTQERVLQEALPVGMGLQAARAVLRSKGIPFQEETETSKGILLKRKDRSIEAAAGDRILSARVQTEAGVYPCAYDLEIVLLFGRDDNLKDQYVHRLRVCP